MNNENLIYQTDRIKLELYQIIIKRYKNLFRFSREFELSPRHIQRLKETKNVSLNMLYNIAEKLGYKITLQLGENNE